MIFIQTLSKECKTSIDYIINEINKYNKGKERNEQIALSNKRLDKLLYFSEIKYMLDNGNTPMYEEDYQAWPSGPAITALCYSFDFENVVNIKILNENITKEMKDAIDKILQATKYIDTQELVNASKIEYGPWYQTYNREYPNHTIPKEEMYSFYNQQRNKTLKLNKKR